MSRLNNLSCALREKVRSIGSGLMPPAKVQSKPSKSPNLHSPDWLALILAIAVAVGFWSLIAQVKYLPPPTPGTTVITSDSAEHLPDPNEPDTHPADEESALPNLDEIKAKYSR